MRAQEVVPVALGLGSSLGERCAWLRQGVAQLAAGGLRDVRASPLYETDPVGCVPGTPAFVNAAIVGTWCGSAVELLRLCRRVERACGRPARHASNEARTLDVDILLFGDHRVRRRDLTVPHPRLTERMFVLVPLCDVAPDWRVPPANRSVRDLCLALRRQPGADPAVRRLV